MLHRNAHPPTTWSPSKMQAFLVPPPPLPNNRRPRKSAHTSSAARTAATTTPQQPERRPSPPLTALLSLLTSLLPRPPAPAKPPPSLPPPEEPDDSDGLETRLRLRDEDGLQARLAARSKPPKQLRRSRSFGFFSRRDEEEEDGAAVAEPPVSDSNGIAESDTDPSFCTIPQHRLYDLMSDAARRTRPPGDAHLATVLPYDLQSALFDDLLSQPRAPTDPTISAALSRLPIQPREAAKEERKESPSFPWILVHFPLRLASDAVKALVPGKSTAVRNPTAAVHAAALSQDTAAAPDTDHELNTAAAAYAAAAAIASSATPATLDPAEQVALKAAVSAARTISTITEVTVFIKTVGIAPLVSAARLLTGPERPVALTALANIAIMLPKSRQTMLQVDEGSIVDTLKGIIDHSRRFKVHQAVVGESALWHTEALVSGTHLLGSLALTRGKTGRECRQGIARDSELVRGLQRLAGGLKNGEPEGAARAARRALGVLGVNTWKPKMPGQRGLRILSIDGGGTRAIMAFEALKQLKKSTGCEIHELFDIIGGTSTGAIVAASIGIAHKTVEEVELLYRDMIGKIFAKHPVNGPKMLLTKAYYDTGVLESTLQRECGKGVFIDSLAEDNMNKVFVVSSIMSRDPKELHLFRNYTYPLGHESRYAGTVEAQLWEGLRASSAAPTFFSEIRVNGELHADGAIVANNPTAVALHETKSIYPGVPIELLVSLGNGLTPASASGSNEEEKKQKNMGWGDVVGSIVASATSTEVVHHALQDLFPKDKYFRFNPPTDSTQIDETHPETLASFVQEAQNYISTNKADFDLVAKILRPRTPRSLWRRFRDALAKEMQELETSAWEEDLYLP